MRALRWLLWPILLVALAGAAVFWPKAPIAVRTVPVARGEVEDVVTSAVAGEVKPRRETAVRSEISGRVAKVLCRRGDRVAQGQTVVELDAAELDARIDEARAQLESARAALAQAEAQQAAAEPTAQRLLRLAKQGAATQEQADRAGSQELAALAALASAKAQIAAAQAALELARLARKKATVTAPFAGALQQLYPEVGADLAPGAPVFDLLDPEAARVETTIDEADAARIQLGEPAELTLDAYPGVRFGGRVSLVAPAVAPDPRLGTTRSLPIWIAVDPDPRLRIGMSTTVEVIVARKSGVLWVPSQAVVGRGARRNLWLARAGVAREVPVETGISNWERTEITAGLAEGDRVITTLDVEGLRDGARVADLGPDAGR